MRRVEGAADLRAVFQRVIEWQRAFQRLPVQILEHEVARAIVFTDVVDRADVRMAQRRDRTRLAFEALAERPADRLDRDQPIEPRVARLPHLAHAAGAKGGQDLVRAEAGAGDQGQEAWSWIIGTRATTSYVLEGNLAGFAKCDGRFRLD